MFVENTTTQTRTSMTSAFKKALLLSGAAMIMGGTLAMAGAAYAQSEPADKVLTEEEKAEQAAKREAAKDADKDEIVITATGMRTGTTSQVLSIDTLEIERLGLSNVDELMRILPQNFSNINSSTNNGVYKTAFANSSLPPVYGERETGSAGTGANFRGLGNNATLTLINGRRISQDSASTGSFSDVSIIPLAAIERVEVLTDGASTVYGSGAIAGVINFILKKDYRGAESSVRYENSETGGDRLSFSQVVGFGNDRARVLAGATYSKSDPVIADKAIKNLDLTALGGQDFQGYDTMTGGVFFSRAQNATRGSAFIGLANSQSSAGLGIGDLVTTNITPRRALPKNMTPEEDRYSGFANFEFDLNSSVQLFAEGLYSHRKVNSIGDYITARGPFLGFGNFVRVGSAACDADPTNTPHGCDALVFGPTDPAFRFGSSSEGFLSYAYIFDRETDAGLLPRLSSAATQDNLNINAGANFELPFKDWKGTSAFYYSTDKSSTNVVVSRTSQDGFRFSNDVLMLMKGYTVDGLNRLDGRPSTDPSAPSVALNLFGNGTQNSQNVLDLLYRNVTNASSSSVIGFQTILDGSIFEVPGGDVKLAFGGDIYKETLEADGLDFSGTLPDPDKVLQLPGSEQTAFAVFGELSIPIVGEANAIPGINLLQIGLAARYDSFDGKGFRRNAFSQNSTVLSESCFDFYGTLYCFPDATSTPIPNASDLIATSTSNTAFSPKVGIKWQPTDYAQFFFNWSKSFRAPTLHDQFFIPGLPVNQAGVVDAFAPTFAPGSLPAHNAPVRMSGGNARLKPVTADNYSLGFDFVPPTMSNLRFSAKYAYIDLRNEITEISNSNDELVIFNPANSALFSHLLQRDANGFITFYDDRPLNVAKKVSETMDLSADYSFDMGDYAINVGGNVTHTFKFSRQLVEGGEVDQFAGTDRGPLKWTGYGYVGVGKGNWYARTNVRYQGPYSNTTLNHLITPVDPYTTVDLNLSYNVDSDNRVLQGTRISIGVNNLFSPDFPVYDETPGIDRNRVDVRKRVLWIDVKKEF